MNILLSLRRQEQYYRLFLGGFAAMPLTSGIIKRLIRFIRNKYKKQRYDEVLPGEVPGRTVLIRGEGIRYHRFSIGSTSVPPRVASLVTFLSTQESNAPRRGADDRHPQHGA